MKSYQITTGLSPVEIARVTHMVEFCLITHRELEGVQVNLPTDSEFVAASFTCKHSKKPLITGAL